jgi:hypothetical protein
MSWSSQWSFPIWLSHQYPICIPPLPHSCCMPCPSHPPWLDHSNDLPLDLEIFVISWERKLSDEFLETQSWRSTQSGIHLKIRYIPPLSTPNRRLTSTVQKEGVSNQRSYVPIELLVTREIRYERQYLT